MSFRRKSLLSAVLASGILLAILAPDAFSQGGPLTGNWTGSVSGSGVNRPVLRIVITDSETGGSWAVSTSCHGALKLKDISNGYHHYTELLASGVTCQGGGVDCLKLEGSGLYDLFQPVPSEGYLADGTLHRIASKHRGRDRRRHHGR